MSCSGECYVLPLAGVEEYVSVPLKFLTEILIFTSCIIQSRQGSLLSTVTFRSYQTYGSILATLQDTCQSKLSARTLECKQFVILIYSYSFILSVPFCKLLYLWPLF